MASISASSAFVTRGKTVQRLHLSGHQNYFVALETEVSPKIQVPPYIPRGEDVS
jgi:hypothetical protein